MDSNQHPVSCDSKKTIQLYDLTFLNSKRVSFFKRLFTSYTLPEDYVSKVPQDEILHFHDYNHVNFKKIYSSHFDLTEFDTLDKLTMLGVSFLWYVYNYIPSSEWQCYWPLRIKVREEYERLFGRIPIRKQGHDLFDDPKDCITGAILFLFRYGEFVNTGSFLRDVIRIFVCDHPFDVPSRIVRISCSAQCELPLEAAESESLISMSIEDFYKTIDCKTLCYELDRLIGLRKKLFHQDDLEKKHHRDLENLLIALQYTQEEVKWIISCLPTKGGRTSIVKLLTELEDPTSEKIYPFHVKQTLKSKMKDVQTIQINGQTVCMGCWIVEKTYYHYKGRRQCKIHAASNETNEKGAPAAPTPAPVPTAPPVDEKCICPICLERNINVTFGCGHLTCSECSTKIRECPICRTEITMRITVFL